MLQTLYVKNMALIDELELDLGAGLNILTGETGAGKSIIIDSIGFALGEKADRNMAKEGEAGYVELVFGGLSESALAALRELEIEPEDGAVILSRKMTGSRSVSRVNGESVTAAKLKAAAASLIDIHGQHEHQSLLHASKHLEYLDDYAGRELSDVKEQIGEAYREYVSCKKELDGMCIGKEEQARELSFLEYEVSEIEAARLEPGEDVRLEDEYRRMANARKIMEALQAAEQALGENGASPMIGRGVRELVSAAGYDSGLSDLSGQLSQIEDLLADFMRGLAAYMDGAQFDGAQFAQIESRLDEVNRLKAKYGGSIEKIFASLEEKRDRIGQLRDYDAYEKKMRAAFARAEGRLDALCEKAGSIRREAGARLREKMESALQDLNFLDVRFDIEFSRAGYSADGYDAAEFMISVNPGEPMRQLKDVASGGELSRIMLALKSVLAENDGIGTLIFDEIDSGISGRTAQKVSEKLKAIARNHQVICITHLPQIAAMADVHFYIEKTVEGQATRTRLTLLDEEGSVAELGRMLGGAAVTDKVLENAREMKKMARMRE